MKWIVIAASVLAGIAVLAFVAGSLVPRHHTATCRVRLAAARDDVWSVLTDFARWGEWNSFVERMEPRASVDGNEAWTTFGKWGEMPTVIEVREPPSRLVTFVDGGSFRGRWRYDLSSPADGSRGTILEITEEGEVGSPLFRTMMLFRDVHASLRTCMTDLAAKLGESARPQNVRRSPNARAARPRDVGAQRGRA